MFKGQKKVITICGCRGSLIECENSMAYAKNDKNGGCEYQFGRVWVSNGRIRECVSVCIFREARKNES